MGAPFSGKAEEPGRVRFCQSVQRTACAAVEPGRHGGDEGIIPQLVPGLVFQGVEKFRQLGQGIGPVTWLDIGGVAEGLCQLFQDPAAEINPPGVPQDLRLAPDQHDGLLRRNRHTPRFPDPGTVRQFPGRSGQKGKFHIITSDISYTREEFGTSLEFFPDLW